MSGPIDAEGVALAHARAALVSLATELSALSRLEDADELRRRAGWAAADADAAVANIPAVQS